MCAALPSQKAINLDEFSNKVVARGLYFLNSCLSFFSPQKELSQLRAAVNKMKSNWGVGGNFAQQTEADFQVELNCRHCTALVWSPHVLFCFLPFFLEMETVKVVEQ